MNRRIESVFSIKTKKLVTFITGGDPNINTSLKIMTELVKSGADIIEVGMPFSDPMADGPTIQLSSIRAIKNKTNLDKIFLNCKKFRKNNDKTPIILMGYYNPIFHYDNKKFINKCSESGIDGLIIVDLQPEEDGELYRLSKNKNIEFIRLVTPTTDILRLNKILKLASGFLYYVSVTGITGQKSADENQLKKSINLIKNKTKLPILVGFGIKNPIQAKKISSFSDGVIVGSSIVKIIENHIIDNFSINTMLRNINKYINSLSKAINK